MILLNKDYALEKAENQYQLNIIDEQTKIKIVKFINSLPSAQSEQIKMIKEIREWINSGNRGSADYFIVDKIEEIINKYE